MVTPTVNLTLPNIQTEFGGTAPISLTEYYRGGANVPINTATSPVDGVPISTSGEIRMGMFRGLTKSSPAGSDWTYQPGLKAVGWPYPANDIAWSGSMYLIGDAQSAIATSPDGVTWTKQPGVQGVWGYNPLYSIDTIAWNGSVFLVGSINARCAASFDGYTWMDRVQLRNNTAWGQTNAIHDSLWDGTRFVIAGGAGSIATSPDDGYTWTYQGGFKALPQFGFETGWISAIAWNGSTYVACGTAGNSGGTRKAGIIATSPDTITWTVRTDFISLWGAIGDSTFVENVIWNGREFYAAGVHTQCASSPDGITWTNRPGLSTLPEWAATGGSTVMSIVWDGSQYTAGGWQSLIATSFDGITWTNQLGLKNTAWTDTGNVFAMNWNGRQILACGPYGDAATSP